MKQRNAVLAIYCAWNAAVQFEWLRFAPVTNEAAQQYGVSIASIGILSLLYPLLSILLAFPVGSLLNRISVSTALRILSLLMVVGALGRLCIPGFPGVLAAQVILGIGQPIGLALVARLVTVWFPQSERLVATSLGTMSIFLGISAALIFVPFTASAVGHSLQWDAAVLIPFAIASWFVTPRDSLKSDVSFEPSWLASASALFQQPAVPGLMALMFVGNGFFNALFTWLEPLLAPRGISTEQSGVIGLLMLFGGLAGMALVGKLRLGRHNIFVILIVASILGIVPTLILLRTSNVPTLCIVSMTIGALCLAPLPLLIEMVLEEVGDKFASTAVGVLWLIGNAGSVSFMALVSSFGAKGGSVTDWIFLPLLPIEAFIAGILLKINARRELQKILWASTKTSV